jgi:hypothetical protein
MSGSRMVFCKVKARKATKPILATTAQVRIIDWWLATKYKTMRVEVFQYPM